jgi:tetratricopeptide (TPR) repeat protein
VFIPPGISIPDIETEQEIFSLDDEMRKLVNDKLRNNLTDKQKAIILLEHIFNEKHLSLQYKGNANIIASEAFHSKTANCMSLTIMAYALAKEAGLKVIFQQVNVPEYWQRSGSYNFITGHVNLIINDRISSKRVNVFGDQPIRIDFDPYIAKQTFPVKRINKNTILAMFYNNKGASALVNKNYPLAYTYFKSAIEKDKTFNSAWGNLGVLYRLTDHYEASENVYRHVLKTDKQNLTILDNLSILMAVQGREADALLVRSYVNKMRLTNPYYHALMGNEAFIDKLYKKSEQHYNKALSLKNQEHEFYLGLAKAYFMQGKVNLAKISMRKAIRHNRFDSTNQLYVAKLNFLKGIE